MKENKRLKRAGMISGQRRKGNVQKTGKG